MTETQSVLDRDDNQVTVERARDFWSRNSRTILIISGAIILFSIGYLVYKYLILLPKEQKSIEAIYKAEEYYRADSLNVALNGDGVNPGFLKVIDNYGGTDAGNLAKFYAGDIYLKQGKFDNAVKYLSDFSTDSKLIQARGYKLLADAYAEQGKNGEALDAYKKAAHHFEEDDVNASDYLFMAAYFADRVLNNKEEAKDLFTELKKNIRKQKKVLKQINTWRS